MPKNGEDKPEVQNAAAELLKGDHILLLFNKDTFGVTIQGNVANLDMAMSILMQAHRLLETEWRIAQGIAAQQKLNQQREDQKRVASILDRKIPFSRH
jgi:hypothetical protein